MQLLHTMRCPIEAYSGLEFVVDLGITQEEYAEALQHDTYALLVDIRNWEDVLKGEKPPFPLTAETIRRLPIMLIRYVATMLMGDALDDAMEDRKGFLTR